MTNSTFFLHVGLPRTATTAMQRDLFPTLGDLVYLGKNWDNYKLSALRPLDAIADLLPAFGQDPAATRQLRAVLPTLIRAIKSRNQTRRIAEARELVALLARCLARLREGFADNDLLYSDESLIESVAGLSSDVGHGTAVPLEQLAKCGALADLTVLVVLRDPFQFLRASWYKNNEFQHLFKLAPISFDDWVRKQMAVYVRQPSASRIFQAMQRSFARHLRSYCPTLEISHYEDFQTADDVLKLLTGGKKSQPGSGLARLPRENGSFRDAAVVEFILSAPGIPPGIGMADYLQTFDATLAHYELADLLREERLRS